MICILFVLSCSSISQHGILPLSTRLDWKEVLSKMGLTICLYHWRWKTARIGSQNLMETGMNSY